MGAWSDTGVRGKTGAWSDTDLRQERGVTQGFYNYKALENSVAPNVTLPPLQKGVSVSLSGLNPTSRSEERTEGHGKTRKRRMTGEEEHPKHVPSEHTPSGHVQQSHALPRAPTTMTEERDSDVEVEVRDEVTSSLSSLSSPSFTSSSSAKELSSPGVSGVTGVPEASAGAGTGVESQVIGGSLDLELESLRQALEGGLESHGTTAGREREEDEGSQRDSNSTLPRTGGGQAAAAQV
ncbi:Ski oncogene [Bagarius yarrelli]|uniref:Ski oncogene n=1 Tax=Bagarius yarrelli TaxID=175774 RepID=A0A556VUU0_BAGYA|nr:Ski oncogene [Bagarius yarrelli]